MRLSQVPNHPNLASSWVQQDLTLLLRRPEKEKAANTEKVNSETTSNSHFKILLQRISPEQKVPDRVQTAQNHCRGAVTGSWALKSACFASLLNSLLYPSSSPRGVLGGQKGSTVWRCWSQGKPTWRGPPQMPSPRMDQHHWAQSGSRAALFCQKNTVVPSSCFSPKKHLMYFTAEVWTEKGEGKHELETISVAISVAHAAMDTEPRLDAGTSAQVSQGTEEGWETLKSGQVRQHRAGSDGSFWLTWTLWGKVCTGHWGLLICVVRAGPRAKAHS